MKLLVHHVKYLLSPLFRNPIEADTHSYRHGKWQSLPAPLERWEWRGNLKEHGRDGDVTAGILWG